MNLLRKYYGTDLGGGEIPDEVRKLPECTLSDAELVQMIDKWNGMLCKSGGQAWVLRVPPDPNYDPDLLISQLCKRFELASEEISRLKAENERLMGEGDTKLLSIHNFVNDAREIVVSNYDTSQHAIGKQIYAVFANTLTDIMDEIAKHITPSPTSKK